MRSLLLPFPAFVRLDVGPVACPLAPPRAWRAPAHSFSLSVARGGLVVVAGPSGVGKSSLLRELAGIGRGGVVGGGAGCALLTLRLKRSSAEEGVEAAAEAAAVAEADVGRAVAFVPQRAVVLPLGCALAESLHYPQPWRWGSGLLSCVPLAMLAAMATALADAGLPVAAMAARHHEGGEGASACEDEVSRALLLRTDVAWDRVLSGGEQQRLGVARLLLRPPAFALLDEAVSVMGAAEGAAALETLRARGVGVVLFTH